VVLLNYGTPLRSVVLLIILISVALLWTGMVTGENTPPRVTIQTPEEGASLALTVTVSGKATDAEGFDIDSYVEARWNDWEWFRLPNTPADGNGSIVFGELVNLDFHAPGEHLLQVRAFDSELYSDVEEVVVTVRDLADLVVLPTDITILREDADPVGMYDVSVVIHNQGGEDVPDVEVVLKVDGQILGSQVIDVIEASTQTRVSFNVDLGEGNVTVQVLAFSLQPVDEKSETNNEAQRSLTLKSPGDDGVGTSTILFATGIVILFIVVVLVVLYLYAVVVSRKD
jgi:hypothetical protein